MPVFTKGNLSIELPFNLYSLHEMHIKSYLDKHGMLFLKAKCLDDADSVMASSLFANITVMQDEDVVFCGLIDKVTHSTVLESKAIDIVGIGFSSLLNIQQKSRSYQDKSNPYHSIFTEIIQDEHQGQFLNFADEAQQQKQMVIQYQETDWIFLKRLASYCNARLVPDNCYAKPSIYLGKPKGDTHILDDTARITHIKKLHTYFENQGIYSQIESLAFYKIGDGVIIDDRTFWVVEANHHYEKGRLYHSYILGAESCFYPDTPLYNPQLRGTALRGRVIDVEGDHVKLHLDIDEQQDKATAKWHPFSTAYTAEDHTGWYVMPQVGDHGMLYVPDRIEDQAFVRNILRPFDQPSPLHDDPDIKYWGTVDERELRMDPERVKISTYKEYIYTELEADRGITTQSILPIKIESEDNINFEGRTINVKAVEEDMKLTVDASNLLINKDTHLRSPIIKEQG